MTSRGSRDAALDLLTGAGGFGEPSLRYRYQRNQAAHWLKTIREVGSLPSGEAPPLDVSLVRSLAAARTRRRRSFALVACALLWFFLCGGRLGDGVRPQARMRDRALLESIENLREVPDIGGLGSLVDAALLRYEG